jgi:hypothetical protein
VRRALYSWTIAFVLLIVAFVATLLILNSTLYSAHGFIRSYLDALNRHDATSASSFAGVEAPQGVPTTLLTDESLASISGIRLVSDRANASGSHTVTYSYTLGTKRESTAFSVRPTSPFLGLFTRWSFARSPLATVAVTVLHDARFRANGTDVTVPRKSTAGASSYVVFAPGLYTFDHRSTYLAAAPVKIPVSEPGSVTPVQVDVQANALFAKDVRSELDKYLTKCATQQVLLPTACPFGKTFNNRVDSSPHWSIKQFPKITIVPDHDSGKWLVPYTTATAHLTVKVQSLFDGSIRDYDKDVPFKLSYSIVIGADNHLTITSLYG